MPLAGGNAARGLPRSMRCPAGNPAPLRHYSALDADYSARLEVLGPRRVHVPVTEANRNRQGSCVLDRGVA